MNHIPFTFAASVTLGLLPLTMVSCENKDEQAQSQPLSMAPKVEVTHLEIKDIPIKQEWMGTLRGTEDAEIRPQVSGYLLSKDYKDGAYVEKGQILFQIDKRPFEATLAQAKGKLAQLEATLQKYKLDVDRYTPLVATAAVSRKQLDDAKQAVLETEASIEAAKASVKEAEINLQFTTIKAPISGLAGLATPSLGDLLTPSSPSLTTISDINPIRVDFSVNEKDLLNAQGNSIQKDGVQPNIKFDVILQNGETYPFQGEPVAIDRNVSKTTGTINIVGHIPNPNLLLRPGMNVRVRATVKTIQKAILVPQRAIFSVQSAYFIIWVDDKNVPHLNPIEKGEQYGNMTQILIKPIQGVNITDKTPIVVVGVQNAARQAGMKAPVNPIPYVPTISQPTLQSIGGAKEFNQASKPAGMEEGEKSDKKDQ